MLIAPVRDQNTEVPNPGAGLVVLVDLSITSSRPYLER